MIGSTLSPVVPRPAAHRTAPLARTAAVLSGALSAALAAALATAGTAERLWPAHRRHPRPSRS